jgi:hypothetical protein
MQSPTSKVMALLTLFALSLLATPTLASAGTETEPNNTILTANGPISSESYSGELQGESDVDWYWMQLGSQQQITLKTGPRPKYCGMSFALVTSWGDAPGVIGYEEEYRYTVPAGGGKFYVRVSQEDDTNTCAYSFSVTPQSAFVAPPPPLPQVKVPEPNELPSQAYGPMKAGIVYTGTIETPNDEDWLYLEGRRERTISVIVTKDDCDRFINAAVYREGEETDARGIFAGGEYEGSGKGVVRVGHQSGRYTIDITGDEGCTWQLEVSPPQSLLGSSGGSGKHSSCGAAKLALRRDRNHLRRSERAAARVRAAAERRHSRHLVATRRSEVRAASQKVRRACG